MAARPYFRLKLLKWFPAAAVRAFLPVFLLAGCDAPHWAVAPEPEGRLNVLTSISGIESGILPNDWVMEGPGDVARQNLSVVEKGGVLSLKVTTARNSFVVVRRTQALLLATPYLTWAWNMDRYGAGTHPVRLVIGFKGGTPEDKGWGGKALTWFGSRLPPHDRAIAITWEDSALQRGTLTYPKGSATVPHYMVRGGREKTGKWWTEYVDLSRLYSQVWPDDNAADAQVVFIGVASAASKKPTTGHVSKIVLTR